MRKTHRYMHTMPKTTHISARAQGQSQRTFAFGLILQVLEHAPGARQALGHT